MQFRATKDGMMKGYWRIVNDCGETVQSGLVSAGAAKEIAAEMTERKAGRGTFHVNSAFCRCGTCND